MSNLHYKQFKQYERLNLSTLIGNKQTHYYFKKYVNGVLKEIPRFTINISELARRLKRHRNTIKAEILRGQTIYYTNNMKPLKNKFTYHPNVSEFHKKEMDKKHAVTVLKIENNIEIKKYVNEKLKEHHSLKSIAGRMNLEFKEGKINFCISAKTLYNYSHSQRVKCINKTHLIYKVNKTKKDLQEPKRIIGTPIQERPESINNNSEFGHFEMDTVVGRRSSNKVVLVFKERKTKFYIGLLINDKRAITVTQAIRQLQINGTFKFGINIKSITTDNGTEFYNWDDFSNSIDTKTKLDIYFARPYRSGDKGSIENSNRELRRYFPKGTNFDEITQEQLDEAIFKINNIFRGCLGYKTSAEMYNLSYPS